jgi:hypothetical protein
MLSLGMSKGIVVTSYDQAYYMGRPFSTTFQARTLAKLGYWAFDLSFVNGQDISFMPGKRVFERGSDPLDP